MLPGACESEIIFWITTTFLTVLRGFPNRKQCWALVFIALLVTSSSRRDGAAVYLTCRHTSWSHSSAVVQGAECDGDAGRFNMCNNVVQPTGSVRPAAWKWKWNRYRWFWETGKRLSVARGLALAFSPMSFNVRRQRRIATTIHRRCICSVHLLSRSRTPLSILLWICLATRSTSPSSPKLTSRRNIPITVSVSTVILCSGVIESTGVEVALLSASTVDEMVLKFIQVHYIGWNNSSHPRWILYFACRRKGVHLCFIMSPRKMIFAVLELWLSPLQWVLNW